MRVLYSSAILGAALCLAGCVRYQAKPVSPVAAAAAFEQRNLADPGLKHFLQSNLQHELTPLLICGCAPFPLQAFQEIDSRKVGPALLLERPGAQPVRIGDPVIGLIAKRLWVALILPREVIFIWTRASGLVPVYGDSGGRKMYRSRTISQAWSWACCAVQPCCINWPRS
jgi:hypothetical protein